MKSNDTRPRGRRPQRGGRRSNNRNHREEYSGQSRSPRPEAPKKTGFWQKILAFFTGGKAKPEAAKGDRSPRGESPRREKRKPEPVEVTSPRLYVGNLSYDAAESDLFDLFNGVGQVQNAEIVSDRMTYKSKGFGFVTMTSVEEARRAVDELHDKPYMGRSLVVTGSKSNGRHD